MRDLIARVLAKHRTLAWGGSWWCTCGQESIGGGTASGHVADAIVAAIQASQPDHIIDLRPDGFTIQHSMACRLEGRLFDCPFNVAAYTLSAPPRPGRYRCTVDADGGLVMGEAVA